MTLNKRIKFLAATILFLPLTALLMTAVSFSISWTMGWKDSEGLSVPRFLHAPLLSALRGEEVRDSKFAGIVMVVDDEGQIIYAPQKARKEIDNMNWTSMEDAYTALMTNLPNIPINMIVYNYQGRSGVVIYLEHFFAGRKLFRTSALIIFSMYFGLIVLPVLLMSIIARPMLRSFLALETAAVEIGRGNLDTPIQMIPGRLGRNKHGLNELQSLVKAFEQMRVELKENHENQGRIMMAISHDLKTPLTLIKGYVEALKDGMANNPQEVAEYAEIIHDRSMLLEERINDLIYFAKLRTSDWQARFNEFSLTEMIDEAAEIFRNDSLIRKREFIFNSTLNADLMIRGDRKLLFQVFENLFDNACRYTTRNDKIVITAGLSDSTAKVTFEDSGKGIGKEHQAQIFDSFYRADSGRNTRGIGIGLTSAKTIIENHGGSIYYADSDLGGAGFVIELPII